MVKQPVQRNFPALAGQGVHPKLPGADNEQAQTVEAPVVDNRPGLCLQRLHGVRQQPLLLRGQLGEKRQIFRQIHIHHLLFRLLVYRQISLLSMRRGGSLDIFHAMDIMKSVDSEQLKVDS